MKLAVLLLALSGLGCQISPVISDPNAMGGGDLYSDCRRAARDLCEDVERPRGEDELRRCVSKATYQCVAGGT